MKTKTFFAILITMFIGALHLHAQDIIPKPKQYKQNGSSFKLLAETKICYDEGLKDQAELLELALSPSTGIDFKLVAAGKKVKGAIQLKLNESGFENREAYRLEVSSGQVIIEASSAAGIFYGQQTLLQLLPVEIYNKQWQKGHEWIIPGMVIEDAPDFVWRGMMLDVSRYFFEKAYVLKYIDMMAMYKLNTLHLHLIDDAGWRMEIKKYPKLTSIGAWRGTGIERTGGYYTQEDIREMVAYAHLRNVDIIPEIEVPAHTLAAIAAYPWLSCEEKPVVVQVQHSISRELYCVGKESTFEFLENVFAEAAVMFPSKYIHIGGDEARYDRWKACAHCQKRKTDLGLETEAELQVYFNRRMQDILKKYGKTIVGWDDIIEEGLEEKAVGMVWHNKKKAFAATSMGHDIVLTLTDYLYFDFPESSIPGEVKAATWMPPIPFEKVYQFDPVIEGLDAKYRAQVLGGHGALWSDQFIHGTILQEIGIINENRSEAYFDYLTFPRLSALAETVWTSREARSWPDFEARMRTHYNRYDEAGFGYRVPQPKLISKKEVDGGYEIELESLVNNAHIRYTTDGIKPNVYSAVYNGVVEVDRLQDFQAITVVNRHQYSLPLSFPETYDDFAAFGALVGEWRPKDVVADEYLIIERQATGKIDKNGSYEVTFIPTQGQNNLEVLGITIYKNAHKIAESIHTVVVGEDSEANPYVFTIDDYETGADFKIRARVKGLGGNDSYGVIFIKYREGSLR